MRLIFYFFFQMKSELHLVDNQRIHDFDSLMTQIILLLIGKLSQNAT